MIYFTSTFSGILEGGYEEFDTPDDLYDAIGDLLQGVDSSKSEDDIREICERFLHVLKE